MDRNTARDDQFMPTMIKVGDIMAPKAPLEKADVKGELSELSDLAVKLTSMVPRFTTDYVADQLQLSMPFVRQLLSEMCQEGLAEELWQTGQGSAHYKITQQGRDHAVRVMEACGYVGPAPVTLEAYAAMLRWQFDNSPPVKPEHVATALQRMVLPKKSAQLAGLAVSSGRSLFVYGPSGNGKSTLGRCVHSALQGDYWIPYAITVGNSVIRMFDEQCHERAELKDVPPDTIDRRWIRVKRPMVIVGGELTLDLLDLIYSPSFRFYEAPPHLKANGGVFLVDDFGRERISPEQLLNRFITPMEHQIDYFTLRTGQKIVLPLRHVLIIATNLSPELVTDPAFLRRMGYRLMLASPTPEAYTKIFNDYAKKHGATVAPEIIEKLLERYREVNKELRACEPRDLIERCRDICAFHNRPLEISQKIIDLAWTGYFGEDTKYVAKPSGIQLNAEQLKPLNSSS
jgi:energy-coupling factor transporter ATP-binding protein EcfA2